MEKINIAELLMDCPEGMELDCTTWENVTFEKVVNNNIIIRRNNKESYIDTEVVLNQYGCCTNYSDEKCVIFPKGKTTWEGFQRPFNDGDILTSKAGSIFILKNINIGKNETFYNSYVALDCVKEFYENCVFSCDKNGCRLATKEEKGKLFEAIKSNGYKWNFETKTLEQLVKPNFKVGNKIKNKYGFTTSIVKIIDEYYKYDNGDGRCGFISIKNQDEWELVSNKFDINTLKPFDRVLVRTNDNGIWEYDLFSFYNDSDVYNKFHCVGVNCRYSIGVNHRYCIPYDGNEKLLGTTNDCDEYFKTWED